MRRVVVTGIGMITPLAWGAEKTWAAILAGTSGAGKISSFDATDYACRVACEVPGVSRRGGGGPEGGGGGGAARHRRLHRLPRDVDQLQRGAAARLAAVRQGSRRLRDGRGRRRAGARGTGARQKARREDLRRGSRLWPGGRRLPHHR